MLNQKSNATVLNVLGSDFMNARCIADKLDIGKPKIECYTVQSNQFEYDNF